MSHLLPPAQRLADVGSADHILKRRHDGGREALRVANAVWHALLRGVSKILATARPNAVTLIWSKRGPISVDQPPRDGALSVIPIELDWGQIEGVLPDAKTSRVLSLRYDDGDQHRAVDFVFEAPTLMQNAAVELVVTKQGAPPIARYLLRGGDKVKVRLTLTDNAGRADLEIRPLCLLSKNPKPTVDIIELTLLVRSIDAGEIGKLRAVFPKVRH